MSRVSNLEIKTFQTAPSELKPSPIEPSWIIEGSPVARSTVHSASFDGMLKTGLWDCTAGKFRWIYGLDEIVHILEGEARVNDGKTTHVLVPGTVAHFPRGLEAVWEVPTYVRKMFVLREVRRPPRRIVWVQGSRFVFEPRT